jgi:hypothetical protein
MPDAARASTCRRMLVAVDLSPIVVKTRWSIER